MNLVVTLIFFSWNEESNEETNDSTLLSINFVPLMLLTSKGKVIWRNPKPNSSKNCRPIKFRFCKETAEILRQEINEINYQKRNLKTTQFELSPGKIVEACHKLQMSMVDGKVVNCATRKYIYDNFLMV